ncbi:MAG TPA: M20/M25/M40 family metallo-hydrolase [Candidatus Baltobacterales bacterium]|nr:M20/M25/M40 family metallo-hydrolase [Candidatus Baltobacterales bacterium]
MPSSTDRLSKLEAAVLDAVDEAAAGALSVLKDLIRTRSGSGSEGTSSDLASVVGKVFAAASRHGTSVEAQPVAANSENVIEVLRGPGRRVFVIEAHTDAVPQGAMQDWLGGDPYSAAEGWAEYLGDNRIALDMGSARFEATIRSRMSKIWEKHRGGQRRRILYGRGSFDNKGCVVSALLAMEALARACDQAKVRLGGSVITAYTVDEEESVTGIKRFACEPDSWLATHGHLSGPADADGMRTEISGVALDGSYGWVPVVGHRGAVQLSITTHGQAAHAATPELGVNAVEAMARIIVALSDGRREIAASLAGGLETSLLGPISFAIGSTIVGGGVKEVRRERGSVVERSGVNAVPDWCEATVDIRFPQGRGYPGDIEETKDRVVAALADYIDTHVGRDGWSYEVRELVWGPPVAMAPSFEQAGELPLVQEERKRAAQVLGYEPDLETAPGGTDATFMIHQARIPTIVELGPAGGLSHDVHEFVEVDSVIDGAKILALLAIDRLGLAD